jgi:hypothetical protein
MRWDEERFIKVYTRDTAGWLALSFAAQGLKLLLARKVDRNGELQLGKHGRRAVSLVVGHVSASEQIDPALDELIADGAVVIDGDTLIMPGQKEAQEARASDKARAKDYRDRKRQQLELGEELGEEPVVVNAVLPPGAMESPLLAYLCGTYPEESEKWTPEWERKQRDACPAVDLLPETKKAVAWEAGASRNRKHDHRSFLSRWYARQQDRGGSGAQRSGPVYRELPAPSEQPGGSSRVPGVEETRRKLDEIQRVPDGEKAAEPARVRELLKEAKRRIAKPEVQE